MNEEFAVFANKIVKYLNDATIVSRLSHWNVRGQNFYECHLMFERIYKDLNKQMDPVVEQLRACGFNPEFDLFKGPGIECCRSVLSILRRKQPRSSSCGSGQPDANTVECGSRGYVLASVSSFLGLLLPQQRYTRACV